MPAGDGIATLGVAFRTLGCKVNRVESDTIAAELLGRAVSIVDEDEAAVIVINTCTVTGEADAKARKAVRQALKAAGEPAVVVTGCLAAIDADALRSLGERVVVEADKERVAERVAQALGLTGDDGAEVAPLRLTRTGEGFRTRVPVKVQDGCDRFCTYCIVPYARGRARSRAADEVVAEVRALVADGVREVVLTGISIGDYRDESREDDTWTYGLPVLALELAETTDIARVRISSVEFPGISPRYLQAFGASPKLVPHLHIPLQSGSDRILEAMGRPYTGEIFTEMLEAMREIFPPLTYTTDVICGFPGETDADHQATMEVCERVGFSKLHVFRYSPRLGTPAADMPNQVRPDVKAHRAAELRELDERLRQRFIESRLGERVEVLIESVEEGFAEGTTREYLRVRVPAAEASVGELVELELAEEMVVGRG